MTAAAPRGTLYKVDPPTQSTHGFDYLCLAGQGVDGRRRRSRPQQNEEKLERDEQRDVSRRSTKKHHHSLRCTPDFDTRQIHTLGNQWLNNRPDAFIPCSENAFEELFFESRL